ncbi:MAG: hypothetical protein JWO94_830 [Verrucomicrobiaceae bacterium]|nr:hypothetical protein [Verrucomicrobiaceae bacterium]
MTNDGIVCFCYRKTLADLQRAMTTHGSLAAMQEATSAGMACGGCRALLQHHFGEAPAEIYDFSADVRQGATACVKPGNRTMKGFIASTSLLESHVFSSNAVPLQLGACEADLNVEFAIYNHLGRPIYSRSHRIRSGETFHFDTARANLPRPFYGMATYSLDRQNYGASRFNVHWYTKESSSSTHENSATGHPDVMMPLAFDERFLNGPSTVFLALQNPHVGVRDIVFRVYRQDDGNLYDDVGIELPARSGWQRVLGRRRRTAVETTRKLPYMGTMWVNVNEEFIIPAREVLGGDTPLLLRIYTPGPTIHKAPSIYFFFHHRPTNIWSANHL